MTYSKNNPESELRKSELIGLIEDIEPEDTFEEILDRGIALQKKGIEMGDSPRVILQMVRLTIKKYVEFEKEIASKYGDRSQ